MSKEQMLTTARRELEDYSVNVHQNGLMLSKIETGRKIKDQSLKNFAYKSPEFWHYHVGYHNANVVNLPLIRSNYEAASAIVAVFEKIIAEEPITKEEFALLQNAKDADTQKFTRDFEQLISFQEPEEDVVDSPAATM